MQNKKGKKWVYIINFLIVLAVSGMAIYKMLEENGVQTFEYLKELSIVSILFLTLVFFINYYLEGVIIGISVREYKKDFKNSEGFVIQCIGGLFSAITPLKIGYFPSAAYAYSRFDVNGEKMIKSMAKTSFAYQVLSLAICVISLIVCIYIPSLVHISDVTLDLKYVAIIGLVYNSVLMGGYFILILSPTFHNLLLKLLTSVLYKIKKIKNKEEYYAKKQEKMMLIRGEIRSFFKNIKEFLVLFFIYAIKAILFGSIPYIAYLIISKDGFQIDLWLYSIILGHMITYITNIIPIPGASGAAELVFVAVFSLVFFPNNIITSIMLVWRMFSYFINILVGFITFIIVINIEKKQKIKQ